MFFVFFVVKILLRTSSALEKTFGRQEAGSLFREVFSSLIKRGKPFLKKRFFPSNSPFQKTLVRGGNTVGTTINQSAKIRLIRKIRVRVAPLITNEARRLADYCKLFTIHFFSAGASVQVSRTRKFIWRVSPASRKK